MEIADAEQYRADMEAVLARCSSRPVDLLIVRNIADWTAARRGDSKGDPAGKAITDATTGAWGILIRRSSDEGQVYSVLAGINIVGKHKAHELLSTPELFLRHLVLHELAHLENNWGQERENDCDDWAFAKMREP